MDTSPLAKARQQGFRLLSLRARSEREMRDRLARNHGARVTDDVIRQFKEEGLLDDNNYARERARQLAVNHLEGDLAIEADLRKRGIERAGAAEAIAAAREELSEAEAIRKLIAKKQATLTAPPDRIWKGKTGRYLMSKGFPAGLILELLNE